ncbi:MAG: EAL domain-containing protein [Chromatiales bacterium]
MQNPQRQGTQSIKLQRRLYRLAVLGIFATTLVIGGIATALHYQAGKEAQLHKLEYEVELQTIVLGAEVSKLTNLAKQITSRTIIRQKLEKYNLGEIDRQELSDFTTPKLQDAMRLSKDIVGITRVSLDGEALVQVGEQIARENWPQNPTDKNVYLGAPGEHNGVGQLLANAPILNRYNEVVGYDIVAFSYQTITSKLVDFYERHDSEGSLRIAVDAYGEVQQFFKVGETLSADVEASVKDITHVVSQQQNGSISETPAQLDVGDDLLMYQVIGDTAWIFFYQASQDYLFGVARRNSLTIALSMLAVMLVGLVITTRLMKPLSQQVNSQTQHLLELLGSNRKLLDKLEASQSQLQSIIDNAPAVIYVKDANGRYLSTNARYEQVTGKSREEVIGKTDYELFPSQFAKIISSHDAEVVKQGQTIRSDQVVENEAGKQHFLCSKFPLKNKSGEVFASCAISTDISEQIRTDQRLRQSAAVFESTSEGIVITDTKGDIVEVNSALCHMMGYDREELIGANTSIWKSDLQTKAFYKDMWQSILTTGNWRGEIWNRSKQGTVIPELVTISSVRNDADEITHFVAVYSDITTIKESEMQLSHMAHHDVLTGLPNRLLFNDRLNHAVKRAERSKLKLAVIFMDLDQFKHVNDSLGHNVGDQLLIETARLLESMLRTEDTVARIGGDEFTFLIEDVEDTDSLIHVVEKILKGFDRDFDINGRLLRVTPSLGISLYPDDGIDAETLLRNADSAMYRAKSEGRNTYKFYTEELTAHAFEIMSLETNLRSAVNNHQFMLYYQPQFDLQTQQMIGMEVLVRWNHPELGMVTPDRFIPIAEESGLIFPLGNWILRNACQQALDWLDAGLFIGKMAINISGKQVGRGELVQQLRKIFAEIGLDASYVELEVTESAIMGESARAISELEALRELGVSLAIDDFGTGYSSLTYLKKLPIQKLKIDRSFIKDIPDDANDVAITKAVIALGKSLQLQLIAEGVETEVQQKFLIDQGCTLGQGYLLGRPLTADAMRQYLVGQQKSPAQASRESSNG